MLHRNSRGPLRSAALAALTATALAACGGGDGGGGITGPTEKTCAQDPTQAKCQPTTPTTTGPLKTVAAAGNRYFGTALDASFTTTNSATYDSVVVAEFSMITPGNVLKWSSISRDSRFAYRWTWPDSMLAFATKNGMKMRGHTLAWHNQNPSWLYALAATAPADTMKAVLLEHIDSVVGHYKGKIYAWDVVNEAYTDGAAKLRDTVWGHWLGKSYIEAAFREARKVDPEALLFYNDYNLETPGTKQDSIYALVSDLKSKGLIDGVGFQAHLLVNTGGGGFASKAVYQASLERFANLGLKVELTELDVRIPNTGGATELTAQQQAWGNIVGACKAVPSCDAIVVWGVNDGESWIPSTFPGWGRALLFTDSFGHKDAYSAVTAALK